MRFRKLLLFLPAVFLAGCSTQQVAPVAVQPAPTGYARGIDMATDASDVAAQLQNRPWLQFVARYYRDPTSRWPALSASEARRLSSLGYKIVTVWEWHSTDPAYFTYATGYNDALNAVRQAKTVGQPIGSAIYFAVDFNARGGALYQVDQYFRGVNAGMVAAGGGRPEYKVGVYGSGAVCATIRGTGLAQYAWLTGSTSWDGTSGYSGWNIRQAAQGGRFPSLAFGHDANEARNDYGGFRLGTYAGNETPAAAVVTAAAIVPAAAAAAVTQAVAAVVPPAMAASTLPAQPPTPSPTPSPTPAVRLAAAAPPPASAAAQPPPTLRPPSPSTAAPAAVAPSIAPRPGTAAAEVAALAAAESESVGTPRGKPHVAAEPEEPRRNPRSLEQAAAIEDEPREKIAASHAARGGATASRRVHTASMETRAVAVPHRHGGASLASAHEPEHRAPAPRRSEEHHASVHGSGKTATAHAPAEPARRNVEERRARRGHHAAAT